MNIGYFWLRNLLRNKKAVITVPTNGAVQYNHKFSNTPENSAGANALAGFIEAPEIKAKKKMSSPTIPPIAIPPNPRSPFV